MLTFGTNGAASNPPPLEDSSSSISAPNGLLPKSSEPDFSSSLTSSWVTGPSSKSPSSIFCASAAISFLYISFLSTAGASSDFLPRNFFAKPNIEPPFEGAGPELGAADTLRDSLSSFIFSDSSLPLTSGTKASAAKPSATADSSSRTASGDPLEATDPELGFFGAADTLRDSLSFSDSSLHLTSGTNASATKPSATADPPSWIASGEPDKSSSSPSS